MYGGKSDQGQVFNLAGSRGSTFLNQQFMPDSRITRREKKRSPRHSTVLVSNEIAAHF